ncbi:UNVERIFIED_CONTAM: hypothetical protein FKN15_077083 [Acipenser sinensis]
MDPWDAGMWIDHDLHSLCLLVGLGYPEGIWAHPAVQPYPHQGSWLVTTTAVYVPQLSQPGSGPGLVLEDRRSAAVYQTGDAALRPLAPGVGPHATPQLLARMLGKYN